MSENKKIDGKELSYNDAIKEIEAILKEMQSDNCDIDRLAANTRRASELIKECRERLLRTEQEVQNIITSMPQGN